jgi:hypothetical protein
LVIERLFNIAATNRAEAEADGVVEVGWFVRLRRVK